MKKLILFLTVLSLQYSASGQNVSNDYSCIIIEKEKFGSLYVFDKESERANIKILDYDKRHQGFEVESKPVSDDDIVIVRPQPNSIFTEFVAKEPPKILHTIDNLKVFNIEDVSKGDKNIWQKHPYYFQFIEEQKEGEFLMWKMRIIMQE